MIVMSVGLLNEPKLPETEKLFEPLSSFCPAKTVVCEIRVMASKALST